MIDTIMSRILVVFFLERGTADICAAAFFALAEIFFAFVAASVAAVVLGAHFERGDRGECDGGSWVVVWRCREDGC
jgi:hypothetical protein